MWQLAALAAAGSLYGSDQANKQASATQANALQRYGVQAAIAQTQMQQQQDIAREKMTDVTLQFLAAKGKMATAQAESGVAGNVQKRLKLNLRTKASKIKSDIARDVDTNVVNIANKMLINKIDTDKTMADAQAQKTSTAGALLKAGFAATTSYAQAGGFATSTPKGVSVGQGIMGSSQGMFGIGGDMPVWMQSLNRMNQPQG